MSRIGFYESTQSLISGRLLFEALGTYFLVLVGTKAATDATMSNAIAGAPTGSTGVALAFSATLAILVYALGPRTGAHLNPAVTLAALLVGAIRDVQAVAYMIAQVVGAVLASLTLRLTLPHRDVTRAKLGLTALAPGYDRWSLLVYEFLGTLLLVLAVLFAAVSSRVHAAAAGVTVGGALFAAVLFAGPVTGGGINPARVLGPMFLTGIFTNWWLYLLAELLGAWVAVLLYRSYGGVQAP